MAMNEEERREIEQLRARIREMQQESERLLLRLVKLEQRVGYPSAQSAPEPVKPAPAPVVPPRGSIVSQAVIKTPESRPAPSAPHPVIVPAPASKPPPPPVTPVPIIPLREEPVSVSPKREPIQDKPKPVLGSGEPPIVAPRPIPHASLPPAPVIEPAPPQEALEIKIGRWLPWAGLVILVMGLVFLAVEYHAKLPKPIKIGLLYAISAGLGWFGIWLERKNRERYGFFGQAVLAGGLAVGYFVTYAIHHAAALQVITDPLVDAMLLLVWAIGMVWVSHWKQSQPMAGLAFFLGYFSAVLPQTAWGGGYASTPFTLVAVGILAAGIVFLFIFNGWSWLNYGGILATYAAYWLWFSNNQHQFTLQAIFLALFWVVFVTAVLFGKPEVLPHRVRNVYGSANNFAYFGLMTWALYKNFEPTSGRYWIFPAVFGAVLLGCALLLRKRFAPDRTSYETYSLQSLAFFSLAIITKFSGYEQVIALSVQAAVMLVLGWRLNWFAARFMAHAAYLIGFLAELFESGVILSLNAERGSVADGSGRFVGLITGAVAGLVMAWFDRWWQEKSDDTKKSVPFLLTTGYFAGLAACFALYAANQYAPANILPGVLGLSSAAILIINLSARNSEIALASQLPLAISHLAMLVLWAAKDKTQIPVWGDCIAIGYTFVIALTLAWQTRREDLIAPLTGGSMRARANLYFSWATVLLTLMVFKRVETEWLFVTLASEAVLILAVGIGARLSAAPLLNGALLIVGVFTFLATHHQTANWLASQPTSRTASAFLGVGLYFVGERLLKFGSGRFSLDQATVTGVRWLSLILGNVLLLDLLWLRFDSVWFPAAATVASAALLLTGIALRAQEWKIVSQIPLVVGQLVLMGLWATKTRADLPLESEAICIGYTFALAFALLWRGRKANETFAGIGGEQLANAYYSWATALAVLMTIYRADKDWEFAALGIEAVVVFGVAMATRLASGGWLNVVLLAVSALDFLMIYDQKAASLVGLVEMSVSGFAGCAAFFVSERMLSKGEEQDPFRVVATRFALILGTGLLLDLWRLQLQVAWVTPLWAVTGFALFGLGLGLKARRYRWSGLAVMGLALFRAFVFDVWKFNTLGRLVSFVVLGALIMALGFLYARFREKIEKLL